MSFPHLFAPVRIGARTLKNRVVLPPHAHVVSTLWGSEQEAERHLGYWAARTSAGWVDGVSAHVRNSLIPGFEPTGVGAIEGVDGVVLSCGAVPVTGLGEDLRVRALAITL